MRRVKVGVCALNQTPLAWNANLERITRALQQARNEGVGVLCLPELCISGYGCEDAFAAPWVQQTALEILGDLLPETLGIAAAIGLPLGLGGVVYDAAALCVDSRLVGIVCKRALAGDGLHYEPRWFKPWPGGVTRAPLLGREVAVGDLIFDLDGVRLGFEICEDAWVTQRPGVDLALDAVDLVLNTSASHFAFGKNRTRRRLIVESSRALGVTYLYANLIGNEAGRALYDGHTLIAAGGDLLCEGKRFSFADVELTTATVDVELARTRRAKVASFRPRLPRPQSEIHTGWSLPSAEPALAHTRREEWENGPAVKEEEFTRAVSLGLFDYVRKSCSRGFIVSLSGGADSAAVSCLAQLALRFASSQLSPVELKNRLDYWPELFDGGDAPLADRWLTTVYQATDNSSERTRSAAQQVAEALGSRHYEIDVQSQVNDYVDTIGGALGRKLDWAHDDIALQNIQARARAPSAWMLANLQGALLLATSNRSEAAVGYATMDGDTCGGVSPIAGIDKAFLRSWLRWLQVTGPIGSGNIPALSAVNQLTPTAELRPPEAEQTDEKDLMPYPVLDAVERAAIRDGRSPRELLSELELAFPDYSRVQLCEWITRFFKLFARNQWKRERYAPSFHVDDENLDPKTWYRFPILSGGYRRELAELAQLAGADR